MLKIFIITVLVVGITTGTYITYQFVSTPKPSETPIPETSREGGLAEPFEKSEVVSDQFVKVIFKEGVDVAQFAKKYNIDPAKIEGPDLAKAYRIPVPEGENVASARDLFREDPDVVSVKFEIYSVPQ